MAKEKVEKPPQEKKTGPVWSYYKYEVRLLREMLGTCPEAGVHKKYVIDKAREEIDKANKLNKKILSKQLEKFKGVEITKEKELSELKGIVRAYQDLAKNVTPLPSTVEELLDLAKILEEEFNAISGEGEIQRPTVFQRDPADGWPRISTHIILGNIKENLRIVVNSGDKSVIKSKVAVGETMAMAIKAIEEYARPSHDVVKDAEGNPIFCERIIHFNIKGVHTSAIGLSETLPAGTTFGVTLRVLKDSSLDDFETLKRIFEYGKNNGYGAWRGSGNKGGFEFKLEHLPNFKEVREGGWM